MIEDKNLGLKIAENHEEKLWNELKEKTEKQIAFLTDELYINKEIVKLCREKLKKWSKQ